MTSQLVPFGHQQDQQIQVPQTEGATQLVQRRGGSDQQQGVMARRQFNGSSIVDHTLVILPPGSEECHIAKQNFYTVETTDGGNISSCMHKVVMSVTSLVGFFASAVLLEDCVVNRYCFKGTTMGFVVAPSIIGIALGRLIANKCCGENKDTKARVMIDHFLSGRSIGDGKKEDFRVLTTPKVLAPFEDIFKKHGVNLEAEIGTTNQFNRGLTWFRVTFPDHQQPVAISEVATIADDTVKSVAEEVN